MTLRTNTGFIETPIRGTDWICGANTGISFQEMNHMGDWTVFLPSEERQSSIYFDSMACVTFSALNSIESQIRAHLAYQRLSTKTIWTLRDLGYFNDRLEFNLSDRFTAKMSGTTHLGNSIQCVWDSIRKDGVVPEGDYGYYSNLTWDDYYCDVPQNLKDKGRKFLDLFDIKYEWLSCDLGTFQKQLFQAPIQVAAPTCSGWNTDVPINKCSLKPNHATMVYRVGNTIHDFDTYSPFRKELVLDYPIFYALKGVVIPK